MIREDRFVLSHKQYAVDMSQLSIERHEPEWRDDPLYLVHATAVWYRRRRRETVACIGQLRTWCDEHPVDVRHFLEQYTDGRYGGDCHGRWDGTSYWGNVPLETQQKHLEILRPMLANFPTIPDGHDGWWRFDG